ncbi:hypothetical protein BBBOND_0312940 [Babesia bigemina]|uniref:Uncharacterized protein n=1 Tax=Babesia bigemina TaxID=5866 RepID=A0A061D9N3_BABBI|nr:hypothetical protein BBBOND_0312940 [Babesia bigemina]CDR97391.1 hypothetical protein BBBOND_0312940 [Babesia bigemina]|eukprot:XP_012769577.1 hypothetical protein BBBOND_0312940 [Babesia bigemina]
MVYYSLTEVPRNLKEAVDWLIALKGTDAENNLKAMGVALYDFLGNKPVGKMELRGLERVKTISKVFFDREELKDMPYIKEMRQRFEQPMNKSSLIAKWFLSVAESDYDNVIKSKGLDAGDISEELGGFVDAAEQFLDGVKPEGTYESAYHPNATWETSCTKSPEACARVLVGIAPMLYAGLRLLGHAGVDATLGGPRSAAGKELGNLMSSLGYTDRQRRPEMTGSEVRAALSGMDQDVLGVIYDLAGFWAFY